MIFPGDGLRVRVGHGCAVAEDMRMARDHLGRDGLHDIAEREQAGFLGHARVIDDLEQQVAQFVLQARPVLVLDGAGDLIGFLDRVRRDGLERLFAVPRAAAVRIAQAAHDLDQVGDVAGSAWGRSWRLSTRASGQVPSAEEAVGWPGPHSQP